jgi:hypothetical protein
VTATFAFFTPLATQATGEHYVFDLLVALPWTWSSPGSLHEGSILKLDDGCAWRIFRHAAFRTAVVGLGPRALDRAYRRQPHLRLIADLESLGELWAHRCRLPDRFSTCQQVIVATLKLAVTELVSGMIPAIRGEPRSD